MNRKTVIITSILGAFLTLSTAHADVSHADFTLQKELQGISAISPDVGPSMVVRTERTFDSETHARAAALGLVSAGHHVVARYGFTHEPASVNTDPHHDRLVGIGARAPMATFKMVPAGDGRAEELASAKRWAHRR